MATSVRVPLQIVLQDRSLKFVCMDYSFGHDEGKVTLLDLTTQ